MRCAGPRCSRHIIQARGQRWISSGSDRVMKVELRRVKISWNDVVTLVFQLLDVFGDFASRALPASRPAAAGGMTRKLCPPG